MHNSSMKNMEYFVKKYLAESGCDSDSGKPVVMDIGSQIVSENHKSYKQYFPNDTWKYVGVDMSQGRNVDIVLSDVYKWKEIKDNFADVVISGQAFEHIEYFWLTMEEISRTLKPGGLICLIAPSAGPVHRCPVDCWRFYEDGFSALARYAGLSVLETFIDPVPGWKNCVLIAKKPLGDEL